MQPKLACWQKAFEAGTGRISELYLLLERFSLEFLLYIMAGVEDSGLQKNLSRYITQWRREKPDIDGRDLRDMGIAPGPLFGRILRAVLVGKLDGRPRMRTASVVWRWTWPGRKAYFLNKRAAFRAGLALEAQAVY